MTETAAAVAEAEMLTSVFGIPCRHAKVITHEGTSRALLDLAGIRPGQMSAQIVCLDLEQAGQLAVEIDTQIDGHFVLCGLRMFVDPGCIAIDGWRTSRDDELLVNSIDCAFFTDKDAAWMPFDAGAVGGYTKDNPTGMGPMRLQLRAMEGDSSKSLVLLLVGNVFDSFGCRFHADGPVYKPDLTGVAEDPGE